MATAGSTLSEHASKQLLAGYGVSLAREVLEAFGPDSVAAGVLGRIALDAGKAAEALPYLEDAFRLRPSAFGADQVIDALTQLKQTEQADRFLTDALSTFPQDRRLLRRAVRFYETSGRRDEALDVLEKLLSVPSLMTVQRLGLEPTWDPLRYHPRFQALLEKYE